MLGDKLRFRFAKAGALRLLSHHDLMRCFERMLRRADLPFKSTNGFHPSPRVVFALSLPLGVIGRQEVVEIEFTKECDSDAVLAKLNAQAPEGLSFTSATVVPMNATALPRRVVYSLELPTQGVEDAVDACGRLMEQERVWVDRFKPSPKQLNIRPYFRNLSVNGYPPLAAALRLAATSPTRGEVGIEADLLTPPPLWGRSASVASRRETGGGNSTVRDGDSCDNMLSLDLWVTQTGTARADELLRLLDLNDLLEAGCVLSRDMLELRDEAAAADPTDQPPDGPAETLPLNHAIREETPLPAASHFAPMVE